MHPYKDYFEVGYHVWEHACRRVAPGVLLFHDLQGKGKLKWACNVNSIGCKNESYKRRRREGRVEAVRSQSAIVEGTWKTMMKQSNRQSSRWRHNGGGEWGTTSLAEERVSIVGTFTKGTDVTGRGRRKRTRVAKQTSGETFPRQCGPRRRRNRRRYGGSGEATRNPSRAFQWRNSNVSAFITTSTEIYKKFKIPSGYYIVLMK